ncbi:MAG: hypothetical protein NXH95_15955 [Pseudomonadaceae bacterium]|nr:hypothetical protein [Pseudomonadaceae bacterium]
MADLDNARDKGRMSYANNHPDLRKGMPDQHRMQNPLRQRFDEVRDPLIARQIAGMKKTEAQRRDESSGSGMVASDKPFPELKPKHAKTVKSQSFNQAWLREHRTAVMAHYQAQSEQIASASTKKSRTRGVSRGFNR